MKFLVTDTDQGFERIIKNLRELSTNDIDVGFFDGHMSDDETMTMAELAGLQMNGAGEGSGSIPKRDFMSECAIVNEDRVSAMLTGTAKKTIDGKGTPVENLEQVGQEYAELMKESIDDFDNPANRKSTIERKRSGIHEDNPLVDTGSMRDDIESKVRKGL